MKPRNLALIVACALLGGCATTSETPNNFTAERSIFGSPYVAPELDRRAVGPGAEWLDGLLYPGTGNIAYDRDGNRVTLNRRERRILRERSEAIRAAADQNAYLAELMARSRDMTPPPEPTAPPIMQTDETGMR